MKLYCVEYDVEYISENCDNMECFWSKEEAQKFIKELPKIYVSRLREIHIQKNNIYS